MSSTLDFRCLKVLDTIIKEYIATALPVGSKVVAQSSELKLSAASMRNTMSELTELGYLEQPHTSAGRVPTNKAFRFYIDRLLDLKPLSSFEKLDILHALDQDDLDITGIFRRATSLISNRCHQVSMVLAPERKAARWNSIGFAPSGKGKVLAILVLGGGLVETRVIETPTAFSTDELTRFGNYLNSHFRGMTLNSARLAIIDELVYAEKHLEKMFCQALTLGVQAVQHVHETRELFVDGTKTILDQAEFSNISFAREMLAFLEERSKLLELLDATLDNGNVQVSFWEENNSLPGCSMVSASYGASEAEGGVVSVIGPSRMNYSAVMPVVGYISSALTSILQGRAIS